jgi:hypothetical protein
MALSKNEQIALFVVVFLIISVAGLFIFLLPAIEQIEPNQQALEAEQKRLADLKERLGDPAFDAIGQQIIREYEGSKDAALVFHNDEFKDFEIDRIVQSILSSPDVAMRTDNLNIIRLGTTSLSANLFTPANITYTIKELARVNATVDRLEANDPRQMNRSMAGITSRRDALDTFDRWLKSTPSDEVHYDNSDVVKAMMRYLHSQTEVVGSQIVTFEIPMNEAQKDALSMHIFNREQATYIRSMRRGDEVDPRTLVLAATVDDDDTDYAPPPVAGGDTFMYAVELVFYIVEPLQKPDSADFRFLSFD